MCSKKSKTALCGKGRVVVGLDRSVRGGVGVVVVIDDDF